MSSSQQNVGGNDICCFQAWPLILPAVLFLCLSEAGEPAEDSKTLEDISLRKEEPSSLNRLMEGHSSNMYTELSHKQLINSIVLTSEIIEKL